MKQCASMLLVAIVTSLITAQAWADPPPSEFAIDFSGDAAIWNPFEGFEACESIFGVTLCLNLLNVDCDGKGGCAGTANWTLSGQLSGSVSGPFTAAAKCKTPKRLGDDVCKAQIRSCETTGNVEGFPASITKCSLKGPVTEDGFFDGFGKAQLCIVGVDQPGKATCSSAVGAFPYFVNPPIPWTLNVTLGQDGKNLNGAAWDEEMGFEYEVKGSYSGSKDAAKLSFKGVKDTDGAGASIKIKDLTSDKGSITGGEVKLKVQGNQAVVDIE